MKARIEHLNKLFLSGVYTMELYQKEAARMLQTMDWQKRLKYENMLFVSLV